MKPAWPVIGWRAGMYWMLSMGGDGSSGACVGAGTGASVTAGLAGPLPFIERRSLGPFLGCPVAGSIGLAFVAAARGGSGSCTVRICLARASDLVNERSHSNS